MSSVHAHKFLAMVEEFAEPRSLEQLKRDAEMRFGSGVQFHTCKLEDMDVDTLLAFLLKRHKLAETGAGYVINKERLCNHG